MRIKFEVVAVLVALGVVACGPSDQPVPTQADAGAGFRSAAELGSPTAARSAAERHYSTHLSGREEVPPADTRAQGQFIMRLSADGTTLHYRLIIANITNTRMAHIHLAPAGSNGDIVVWLRPAGPPFQLIPGRFNGIYAEGSITAAQLVGPLAGQPLSALVAAMDAGNTYVNVHTNQYPGGEIRGQIRQQGK